MMVGERAHRRAWHDAVRRGLTLEEVAEEMGVSVEQARITCLRYGYTPRVTLKPGARATPRGKLLERIAELEAEVAALRRRDNG